MSSHALQVAALIAETALFIESNNDFVGRGRDQVVSAVRLLKHLSEAVEVHGTTVPVVALTEVIPLAHAKGESREVLRDLSSNWDRKRMFNAFFSVDPRQEFPVEIISTGGLVPNPDAVTLRRAS